MQGIKVIAILVASFFICACGAGVNVDEQRRAQYLADNPELKITTIGSAIARGEVFTGMTEPEVAAAWGEPCHILRDSSSELWDYCDEDSYVHFNEHGEVVDLTDYQ